MEKHSGKIIEYCCFSVYSHIYNTTIIVVVHSKLGLLRVDY